MELKKKTLRRDEWRRITEKTLSIAPVTTAFFSGYACLLTIHALQAPLWVKDSPFGDVKIADRGFRWLQLAPEAKHWWLTVMYDEHGALIQSYFDITQYNDFSDPENPFFTDLFLDVCIPADGAPLVLDRDELDAAREEETITPEEHALALRTAEEILAWYGENREEYDRFLEKTLESFVSGEQI